MSGYGQQLTLFKRRSSALPKTANQFSLTWKCVVKRTPTQTLEQWLNVALCQPTRPTPPLSALTYNAVLQRLAIARAVLEYKDRLSQRAVHAAAYLNFAAHKVWAMANGLSTNPSNCAAVSNHGEYIGEHMFELLGDIIEGTCARRLDTRLKEVAEEEEEEEESKKEDADSSIHSPLSTRKMARMQTRSARSGQRMTLAKPMQFLGAEILGGKARVLIGKEEDAGYRRMLKAELEERKRLEDEAQHAIDRKCAPASDKQTYAVHRTAVNIQNRNKILQVLGYDGTVSAKLSTSKVGKGSASKVLRLTGEVGSIDTSSKVWSFFGSPNNSNTKNETFHKHGKDTSPKNASFPNKKASITSHFSSRLSNNGFTSPK